MLPDLNNKDLKDWGWKRVWRVGEGVFSSTVRTLRNRTSKRLDDMVLRVENTWRTWLGLCLTAGGLTGHRHRHTSLTYGTHWKQKEPIHRVQKQISFFTYLFILFCWTGRGSHCWTFLLSDKSAWWRQWVKSRKLASIPRPYPISQAIYLKAKNSRARPLDGKRTVDLGCYLLFYALWALHQIFLSIKIGRISSTLVLLGCHGKRKHQTGTKKDRWTKVMG